MIECARCGYRNDAAAKFCAACGAPMLTAQPIPAQPGPGQPMGPPAGHPGYAPAWGAPAMPQPPPNWGPQHWGVPAPQPAPAQWGQPQLAAQQNAQQNYPPQQPGVSPGAAPLPPAPYAAPPAWGAPLPEPVAPAWGQPSRERGSVSQTADPGPLAAAVGAPSPAGAVVPTAASAAVAALEADQIPANAPKTLSAFLVTFDADPLGQFWPIHQGSNLVGRKGSGAEIQVEIDHPTTSSRHALVHAAARPGRLKVEDMGSTNGTYVNERRLEPGERRALDPGDTLRFGGFSVTIILV